MVHFSLVHLDADMEKLEEQISEMYADTATNLHTIQQTIQSLRGISFDASVTQMGSKMSKLETLIRSLEMRQNQEFIVLQNLFVLQDKKLDEIKQLATIRRRKKAAAEEEVEVPEQKPTDGYDKLIHDAAKLGLVGDNGNGVSSVEVEYAKKQALEDNLPEFNDQVEILPNNGTQIVTISPEKWEGKGKRNNG